ncbi:MAG TPA: hypothetical protein VGJ48_25785 [Pyrinomonadaceae bacterium]
MYRPLFHVLAIFAFLFAPSVNAENPTDAVSATSLLSKLPARSIGPAIPDWNSRISCISVFEKDPRIFFVGSASGGVLKTEDGGKNFSFIFDKEGASSIGDVVVSQSDRNVVWVGTGEGWHRNDSAWGDGIYKTTDGGKTWKNMGLPNSNSFGKIVIDPTNNNVVFAAVLGSQWGPGSDRGVYRTTDGGKSWKKVLYVEEKTGAADIAIDPKNPKNLLAAMWDHVHRPYHYYQGGPGSGIYRSTDGGATWHKVTKGLPTTELGRISVDYFRKDSRNVAATIEAKAPATGFYRSTDGGETWVEMPAIALDKNGKEQKDHLYHWGRPFYNNLVRYDPEDVNKIYHGNPWHFTADGGKTFVGYAGDDHALWIDPTNTKHVLFGNDQGVVKTWDGGKPYDNETTRYEPIGLPPLGQFYGIGYDMRKPYWVMGGRQDGENYSLPTQTQHGGVTTVDINEFPGGDGQKAMADPNDWTTVYSLGAGGNLFRNDLRDGSVKRDLDPLTRAGVKDAYTNPLTNQAYLKRDMRLRTNPSAPLLISPWNSKTIYYGSNYLFKSVDRGDHWRVISPDLTHDKMEWQIPQAPYYGGNHGSWYEVYQAIRTISESPVKQGIIWVGTDDGYIQLTMDDGAHWTNVTKNIPDLPEYTEVSHIYASRHSEGRAYATFDGHRNGDLNTYVYVTEDYGKAWTKINGNLPEKESVYVIKEGLKNPDLLFLGTEFSLWVSLDRGKTWTRYRNWELDKDTKGYFPTVAVHDLEIHPRELDLIIGSHGRSIWTLPIRALEELTDENRQKEVYFVSPGDMYLFPRNDRPFQYVMKTLPGGFYPNTQPGTLFYYHLKRDAQRDAGIVITDASGNEVYASLTGPSKAGLNVVAWCAPASRITIRKPGDYRVTLTIDGKEYARTLHAEDASFQ